LETLEVQPADGHGLCQYTLPGENLTMLKIDSVANGGGTITLILEGRLIGPWVEELRQACKGALDKPPSLTLDLAGVAFVDRAGVELLRSLADRHARLSNCSPFVAEQLKPGQIKQAAMRAAGRRGAGAPPSEASERRESASMDAISENVLVERLRGGDAAALEILMGRYASRVYRVARGITRTDADAEEVVQDVFMTLARKIDRFEGRAALSTWIYRVATNAALIKRRGKRAQLEVSLEEHLPTFKDDRHRDGERSFLLADWSQNPEAELLDDEARAILSRAIGSLPEPYRAVLVLRDVEELSNEEAAEILGESVASIKSRVHRARMALREQLTRHWVPSLH